MHSNKTTCIKRWFCRRVGQGGDDEGEGKMKAFIRRTYKRNCVVVTKGFYFLGFLTGDRREGEVMTRRLTFRSFFTQFIIGRAYVSG